MPYDPLIPQPGDLISDSQAQILGNFTSISTAWNINHVDFNLADLGKHKFVTLPEQGAGPVTIANEMALYSKDVSGISQLFLRRESAGSEIQMSVGDPVNATKGRSFLPGNLLIQWGQNETATTIGNPITFSTNFSAPLYVVVVTPVSAPNEIIYVSGYLNSGFTATSKIGNSLFNYIAIGPG